MSDAIKGGGSIRASIPRQGRRLQVGSRSKRLGFADAAPQIDGEVTAELVAMDPARSPTYSQPHPGGNAS
jgi:hypothetical protein